LELCVKYGRELAEAVDTVLGAEMTPVRGTFAARYAEVSLPFEKVPGPEKWKQDLLSKQFAARKRAEHYLKLIEAGKSVPGEYPVYPVQVWKLGDQVVWVSLGGEVVVDYALRLKKELQGPYAVWVTAYANDVMAYIGSARVIREGGYEGDTSMVYYGMPGKWDTSVEEKIISKVHELVKAVNPTP
ncbi:MAG TPA: hypothetical protein VIL46_15520, partial [Gemmataceae bacterium]